MKTANNRYCCSSIATSWLLKAYERARQFAYRGLSACLLDGLSVAIVSSTAIKRAIVSKYPLIERLYWLTGRLYRIRKTSGDTDDGPINASSRAKYSHQGFLSKLTWLKHTCAYKKHVNASALLISYRGIDTTLLHQTHIGLYKLGLTGTNDERLSLLVNRVYCWHNYVNT